jgi:hypothetical protein
MSDKTRPKPTPAASPAAKPVPIPPARQVYIPKPPVPGGTFYIGKGAPVSPPRTPKNIDIETR